ncbi:MAG TPA: hypothetical protein VGX25_21260 [Actinophytocola sp.]|uniref:hypothetical protein n=1 Tax=Actinophytocola sp. TaxID=1872138 RepID=UPI002DDD52C1|nr:hypothetical protein [Actinophytocola sp.]HEV2781925.1 hypothetical protein [Actinophytocola sp.]
MTTRERLLLAVLVLDSALLAVVELLFLPLRFDGYLLPDLGGLPLPLTPVLAAFTTPWLVSAAARLSPRLAVASAPLVVWLLSLGVFGLAGPGGDRVLIEDWRALLLLACGALPAAVKLGSTRG